MIKKVDRIEISSVRGLSVDRRDVLKMAKDSDRVGQVVPPAENS